MLTGWRTVIVGAALAVAGFLQTFDWATIIPAAWAGPVIGIIGVVMVVLRGLTSTPVGVSK